MVSVLPVKVMARLVLVEEAVVVVVSGRQVEAAVVVVSVRPVEAAVVVVSVLPVEEAVVVVMTRLFVVEKVEQDQPYFLE